MTLHQVLVPECNDLGLSSTHWPSTFDNNKNNNTHTQQKIPRSLTTCSLQTDVNPTRSPEQLCWAHACAGNISFDIDKPVRELVVTKHHLSLSSWTTRAQHDLFCCIDTTQTIELVNWTHSLQHKGGLMTLMWATARSQWRQHGGRHRITG